MAITFLESHSKTGPISSEVSPSSGVSNAIVEVIERINSTLADSHLMENENAILCPNCEEVYVERFYPCPICNFGEDNGNIALKNKFDNIGIGEKPIKNRKRSPKKSPEILYKEGDFSVLYAGEKYGKIHYLQVSFLNKTYSFSINYDLNSDSIINLRLESVRIFKKNKSSPHYFVNKDEFFKLRNFILKFLKNHHNVN